MSFDKKEYDRKYWHEVRAKGLHSRTLAEKKAIARTKYRDNLSKTGMMDRSLLL